MKKVLIVLLAFVMAFPLVACSTKPQEVKPQEVLNVEELISAIGEVSVNSKDAISKAEKEYGYLSSDNQSLVSNYGTLLRAKDDYQEALNEFIIGEWTCSYEERGYLGLPEEITETIVLNEGGVGYSTYDDHKVDITWTMNDNILLVTGAFFPVSIKVDFANNTITYDDKTFTRNQ